MLDEMLEEALERLDNMSKEEFKGALVKAGYDPAELEEMNNEFKFEPCQLSWHKRRKPTEKVKKLDSFKVVGFEKINNHRCEMHVVLDGEEIVLSARVSHKETYRKPSGKPLEVISHGWSVQGLDAKGNSVLLKLIE